MKKLTIIILILSFVFVPVFAGVGYEPGIMGDVTAKKGEYKYREVVFLTGEPIVLDGTIKVSDSADGSKTTLEYKLSNTAKNAKLDRKIVYINTKKEDAAKKQITHTSSLDPKFSETITVGSQSFKLTEYLFSRSGITDDKPIMKFNVSNWNGRKVYQIGNNGEVIIDINADQYGYSNHWSSTETAIISNTITYKYKENQNDASFKEIVGTVEYAVSDSNTKYMQYVSNEPVDISFKGGFLIKEAQDNIVMYLYDIPVMENWTPNGKRNKGRDSYRMTTIPTQTRLFAPTMADVSASYWAAEYIESVAALDIISVDAGYFRPLSFMSRAEFARAMVKAANIKEPTDKVFTLKLTDVEKNHPYHSFVKTAVFAGIMGGTGNNKFSPDDYLTKAQALTIIVRAMGLENSADESGNRTPFSDDYQIPSWAKKSVNVALRMGIIQLGSDKELEPNKFLTRAECSEMISNFIKYLQYDIKSEYREKIINYGR